MSLILLLNYGNVFSAENFDFNQNFILFPFIHAEVRPNVHEEQDLESFETEAGSDFFYLFNYKNFRALGELAITSEELELERIQIGFKIKQNDTLWLGRYHAPLGYWNSNYHHGLHLQTSVHRPGIIEYEDNNGVLANHVTGFLYEGQHYNNIGALNYSIGVGYAPTLEHKLEPYSFGNSNNKLNSIIKIGYQSDETSPSEIGIVLNHSNIIGEDEHINQIEQKIAGVYTHQSRGKYRITTAGYFIENKIVYSESSALSSKFAAGYFHTEYDIASKWILYGRIERNFGGKHDPYLALFHHSETQRNLGGVRYDLSRRQAISSEISNRIAEHDSHIHLSIQWSAVLP